MERVRTTTKTWQKILAAKDRKGRLLKADIQLEKSTDIEYIISVCWAHGEERDNKRIAAC